MTELFCVGEEIMHDPQFEDCIKCPEKSRCESIIEDLRMKGNGDAGPIAVVSTPAIDGKEKEPDVNETTFKKLSHDELQRIVAKVIELKPKTRKDVTAIIQNCEPTTNVQYLTSKIIKGLIPGGYIEDWKNAKQPIVWIK